jgi:hypothetical protein
MKVVKKPSLAVRCPTCGASPKEKCELHNGLERTDPHPDRHRVFRWPPFPGHSRAS